jgi:predicted PurR-regulated permease PerM
MIYKPKGTISAFLVLLILLILSLLVLTPMLSMIILALLFAYLVRPLSKKMEPHLKYRSLSITFAMIIIVLPLIAVIIFLIVSVVQSIPAQIGVIKSLHLSNLNSTSIQSYPLVKQYIPPSFYPYFGSFFSSLDLALSDILRALLGYLVGLVQSIPNVALELLILFAATFYFARDGDKLWDYVEYAIPPEMSIFFNDLFQEIDLVLKSIFYGHFITAIITGTISGIGFYLLGYPYPLFLGIITGFLQLIPFIGHWPTYILLALYDFSTGNYLRMIIIIFLGTALSGLDFYLRPKLSGKYAEIHPLIFLLGFICGPLLLGLVGFVLGPMILGVAYAAVVTYKKDINNKDLKKISKKNFGNNKK